MKKQLNFQLMAFVVLTGALILLTTCKKKVDTPTTPSAPAAPTATTSAAGWISQTWATLNGSVSANNDFTTITFEYDTSASYGQTIMADPDTLSGSTSTLVFSNLTGLTGSTTYHYRIKAINSLGTKYGSDMTFTTSGPWVSNIVFNPDLTYGSVSDNDGNTYKTVQIGTQTWMAENLKTTKYNDNTPIPLVTKNSAWEALSTPAYCWYNNDSITYGAIYNWYTLNTGKLCPVDWHVPSDAEWTILTTYLGGEIIAGNKQKETGLIHWLSSNTGATNESGFTALPGGYRNYYGVFNNIRSQGYWWSGTESSSIEAYYRDIDYSYSNLDSGSSSKKSGASVRCIAD